MAIRLRVVDGVRVALCAAETDPQPGDTYLDDGAHYALAAKFALDWAGQTVHWRYATEWEAMASQKLRDAGEELRRWLGTRERVVAYFGVDAHGATWARVAVETDGVEDANLHVQVLVEGRSRDDAMTLAQKLFGELLRAHTAAIHAKADAIRAETAALYTRAGGGQA